MDNLQAEPITQAHRLEIAMRHFAKVEFTRKDYLSLFPNLSTATASRDLRQAIDDGRFSKRGVKAFTQYCVS